MPTSYSKIKCWTELTYLLEMWQKTMDTPISHEKYNPIEVTKFATAHGISDEPPFAWWVPYTLSKRGKIIYAVNARVKRTTQNYGVTVPCSVK